VSDDTRFPQPIIVEELPMKILNLTQHQATPEQSAQGVVEPHNKALIQELLTFTAAPSTAEVWEKARALADLVGGGAGMDAAMIGGAPYLMGKLEFSLKQRGITPPLLLYRASVGGSPSTRWNRHQNQRV
jgi:hypothetical protein